MRQHRGEELPAESEQLSPRLRQVIQQLRDERDETTQRAEESWGERRWAEQRRNVLQQLSAESSSMNSPRRLERSSRRRWAVLCTALAGCLLAALTWWLPAASSTAARPVAVVDEIDHSLAGRLPAALAPGALLAHEFEAQRATPELSEQDELQ